MQWADLDVRANALRRTLYRGALSGLPPNADDPTPTLTPEILAWITLADIEHVREWEREHGVDPTSDDRRQELATMIGNLLTLQVNPSN